MHQIPRQKVPRRALGQQAPMQFMQGPVPILIQGPQIPLPMPFQIPVPVPVQVQVGFPRCSTPGCPCTSTFNGQPGNACCRTCSRGKPCVRNFHPTPSQLQVPMPVQAPVPVQTQAGFPHCSTFGFPCTSTFNGQPNKACCKTCSRGTPCVRNVHPTPSQLQVPMPVQVPVPVQAQVPVPVQVPVQVPVAMQVPKPKAGGAGVLPCINYEGNTLAVSLGEEKHGPRKGLFSLFCGNTKKRDGTFGPFGHPDFWNTALREMKEESCYVDGTHVTMGPKRKPDLRVHSTPIWVARINDGISRRPGKDKRKHPFVPNNEISQLEYVRVDSILALQRGQNGLAWTVGNLPNKGDPPRQVSVSKFAIGAVHEARKKGLL
jgi:hypothetical protein